MKKTPHNLESFGMKKRHRHLVDLGLSSFMAYFFCVLAPVSIRLGGLEPVIPNDDTLVALLSFLGALCSMLLFLAMVEPYMLRHDNHARLSFISGILLTFGPAASIAEAITGASSSFFLLLAFGLSGCGYASCLLVWGRVLSEKEADRSSRQVLADTCAAAIVMVVVSIMPNILGSLMMAGLGLVAGLVGSRRAVSAHKDDGQGRQVVVSDTRNVIPRTAYFVTGTLWLVYGIFWTLLGGTHVVGRSLGVAEIAIVFLAAIAGIAIVRVHRKLNINLSRMLWASIPLLVSGLALFVAGGEVQLRSAAVLVVLSMIASYLHLMAHLAGLARRPDLLSDQLFAWGWLSPYFGMFVGVFAGIICQFIGDAAVNIFLSIIVGVLVVTLIVSMRSVDKIASLRREEEARRRADVDVSSLDTLEDQMDKVFLDIGLSLRERDVAALLLQGRSQAVIANQLFVAPSTVNTHVKHIYQKAGVTSKQEFIDVCEDLLQARSR